MSQDEEAHLHELREKCATKSREHAIAAQHFKRKHNLWGPYGVKLTAALAVFVANFEFDPQTKVKVLAFLIFLQTMSSEILDWFKFNTRADRHDACSGDAVILDTSLGAYLDEPLTDDRGQQIVRGVFSTEFNNIVGKEPMMPEWISKQVAEEEAQAAKAKAAKNDSDDDDDEDEGDHLD